MERHRRPGIVGDVALADADDGDDAGEQDGEVEARPLVDMGLRGPRPRYSALGTQRCRVMPPLESAIDRFVLEAAPYLRVTHTGNTWNFAWSTDGETLFFARDQRLHSVAVVVPPAPEPARPHGARNLLRSPAVAGCRGGLRQERSRWKHRVDERQCQGYACTLEKLPAGDVPLGDEHVSGSPFRSYESVRRRSGQVHPGPSYSSGRDRCGQSPERVMKNGCHR